MNIFSVQIDGCTSHVNTKVDPNGFPIGYLDKNTILILIKRLFDGKKKVGEVTPSEVKLEQTFVNDLQQEGNFANKKIKVKWHHVKK